jgi:hypothetical protein
MHVITLPRPEDIFGMIKIYLLLDPIPWLHRLRWFGHVQRMEENRTPKRVLYMNLAARLRGRPRNRWQDEAREGGRIAGEQWQEKL